MLFPFLNADLAGLTQTYEILYLCVHVDLCCYCVSMLNFISAEVCCNSTLEVHSTVSQLK